jgi:hypothetical protein
MAKFIRYTLATICFAASVGCLALWWRSIYYWDTYEWLAQPPNCGQILQTIDGMAVVEFNHMYKYGPDDSRTFFHSSYRANGQLSDGFEKRGKFYARGMRAHFPLWYPALIFALAGVAALRFRRQFSIRSALIAVSVVAALLGMVVAL